MVPAGNHRNEGKWNYFFIYSIWNPKVGNMSIKTSPQHSASYKAYIERNDKNLYSKQNFLDQGFQTNHWVILGHSEMSSTLNLVKWKWFINLNKSLELEVMVRKDQRVTLMRLTNLEWHIYILTYQSRYSHSSPLTNHPIKTWKLYFTSYLTSSFMSSCCWAEKISIAAMSLIINSSTVVLPNEM